MATGVLTGGREALEPQTSSAPLAVSSDEEALEALAGRNRPLVLGGDRTWYSNAFEALGFLTDRDADVVARARDLRRGWQQACVLGALLGVT